MSRLDELIIDTGASNLAAPVDSKLPAVNLPLTLTVVSKAADDVTCIVLAVNLPLVRVRAPLVDV